MEVTDQNFIEIRATGSGVKEAFYSFPIEMLPIIISRFQNQRELKNTHEYEGMQAVVKYNELKIRRSLQ